MTTAFDIEDMTASYIDTYNWDWQIKKSYLLESWGVFKLLYHSLTGWEDNNYLGDNLIAIY